MKKALAYGGTAFLGMIGGVLLASPSDADPAPAPTVTVTAEPETITETVTETVIPQACLDALDDADDLTTIMGESARYSSDAMSIAAEGVMAAAVGDWDALDALTVDLEEVNTGILSLTDQVNASTYPANRDACREAAGS